MEKTYKLTICYDGSRYFGWEHQRSTDRTIQGKLEAVLSAMLSGEDVPPEGAGTGDPIVDVIGAGRTDAGVHAKAMTASVRMDTPLSEEDIRDYMNRYLPEDIGVTDVRTASDRFHARYSAVGKTYCYSCWYGPQKPVFERKYLTVLEKMPDIARMEEAAALLTGTHDYKSFCGNPKMKKSTVRTVDSIEIKKNGPVIRFYFHGDGFLQHMVRILTGTLLEVGYGKRQPSDMTAVLEARDRTAAGYTAPAQGLCLIKVDY
jgi:tRNA pseudouridine38-40 synthase